MYYYYYGNDVAFTTLPLPTVTTTAVTNIGRTEATSGGTVTWDGGAAVTARGVCWGTTANPTIANPHTTDGSGVGTFTSFLTDLAPGAIYHICAYATNSLGTGYGNDVSFVTPPLKTNDFNGDGRDDIVWRYYGGAGYNHVWFMNWTEGWGPGIFRAADAGPAGGSKMSPPGRVILDPRQIEGGKMISPPRIYRDAREGGDAKAFEKPPVLPAGSFGSSGWIPDVRTIDPPVEDRTAPADIGYLGDAPLPSVADADWKIEGTGDFNGDGKPDLLWRNYVYGYNYVWFMDGTTNFHGTALATVTDVNWRIAGVGDFNGDGSDDILWRYNGEGGYVHVWFMVGATDGGSRALPSVPDLNLEVGGIGDFNGDNKVDILWRNYGPEGYNGVWYMDGWTYAGSACLAPAPDLNWRMEGCGDFNRDGKPDILWRYYGPGGFVKVQFMAGIVDGGSRALPWVPDLNWKIVTR